VKAPTRALIVEDIETWVYILDRAARRAGASEIVVCGNLQMVGDALRSARFDVAILDVGLDPDDDLNSDGIKALEAIREMDGSGTRCVLITGWQGGDRMDLQESIQRLGTGTARCRLSEAPWYLDMLQLVCGRMGWKAEELLGFRTRIEYPLYGSQIAIAYDGQTRPAPGSA